MDEGDPELLITHIPMPTISAFIPIEPFLVSKRIARVLAAEENGSATVQTIENRVISWCRSQDILLLPTRETLIRNLEDETELFEKVPPNRWCLTASGRRALEQDET